MTEKSVPAGECPFCKKNISDSAFMQSETFLAIYNIAPLLRGHSLVIPRRHVKSLFELSKSELAEFILFSRSVTLLLLEAFTGDGFDWSVQEGNSSGQSVPHLHLHIVIRKPNDMEGESEWYLKIKENENRFLDSDSRARLSDEEYRFYTNYLKNQFEIQKIRLSQEK